MRIFSYQEATDGSLILEKIKLLSKLPVAYRLSPFARRLLPIACHLSPVACRLSPVASEFH
jgi:hypothetical protein